MADWCAMVLAGGHGRRLGGAVKPLLQVGGRSILARQMAALADLGATPRLVASDPDPYAGLGVDVMPDAADAGALGGLYTAVAHAGTPYVLVLAGDLPFLTAPFLRALVDERHSADVVLPAPAGRWQPLCAVYAAAVAPHLANAIASGQWRVTRALEGLHVRTLDDEALAAFAPAARLLLNVNTPEDAAAARREAGERG